MAKRLLLNVLIKVLGEYINGLTEENLKLGVWAGKISLHNLELNQSMLYKLNLPVSIVRGSLRSLEIVIPWASLDSLPVKLVLDGVYLLINPLDISSLNISDVKSLLAANKLYKLQQSDKILDLFMQANENSKLTEESLKASNVSFIQRLTSRIIDNIEIVVKNIHFCYEDSISMKGTVFSCGITLDNFQLRTTDSTWTESFVSRNLDEALYKIAVMKNAGIYWSVDSKCRSLSSLSFKEWELTMEAMIYKEINMDQASELLLRKHLKIHCETHKLNYVLSPQNRLSVKVVHKEHSLDMSKPRFDISIQTTGLNVSLNRLQYHQLLILLENQKSLEYQQQLYAQRPSCRPIGNGKLWWKYAYSLISGRPSGGSIIKVLYCLAELIN